MRWLGALIVVGLACLATLAAPAAWAQRGFFPDLAVLAVIYLALRGGPEQAALLGIGLGLAAGLWSPDPFLLRSFTLGALGWTVAHAHTSFVRERVGVQMAFAGLGVLAVRGGEALIVRVFLAADPAAAAYAPWGAGLLPEDAAPLPGAPLLPVATAGICVAVGTALAAPAWFWLLRGSRLLRGFETREVRRV